MSNNIGDNNDHIESVDVESCTVQENTSLCEISCDSGVETMENCSVIYQASSQAEISPIETRNTQTQSPDHTNENFSFGNESSSPSPLPDSISPDNVQSDHSNIDQSHNSEKTQNSSENVHITDLPRLDSLSENRLSASVNNINDISDSSKEMTNSTISLIDAVDNSIQGNCSKSAENLTQIKEASSTSDLNKDEILMQFQNHKQKVAATQKIVPDTVPQTVDSKSRIPKEILSQDIGSIVRNVHGIFSSVSGSLKNAYNYQKVAQKPAKPVKPNSKVLNDIFEDGEEKPKTETVDVPTLESPTLSETENDVNKEFFKLQIESLERVLAELRRENGSLKERLKKQTEEIQAKDQAFKDLEAKVELMSKRTEQAQKEKDAAVMRYASLECTVIEARKAAENSAKAEKAAITEKDLMGNKLKMARDEKQRICQLYDDKCHELSNSEKETAKLREDLKELEGRLKWTQSKLRVEMDAYKESADRVDKLTQQVAELEAAKEAAIANSTDSIRAKQLETELKETQATLILCKHEKEDLDKRLSSALQQIEIYRRERDEANSALSLAQTELEKVKQHASSLEEEAAELAALRAQAALADTLNSQLQRETELRTQAESALSVERSRAETCLRREAAALQHAARLTATHVAERARAQEHEHKAQALSADNASLREKITTLEAEITTLQGSLQEETERRNKETRVLARKVAELTEEAADANKKLEWEKGEVAVLKKKHASAIKELNRELQRALKRVEQLEAKLPQNGDATSTRTGSVTSLSSSESTPQEERLNGIHEIPEIQTREPDRQALIERIVHLQRSLARRSERCDFLEEHAKQLTTELKGKSKLLRHVLASMPAGSVTSQDSDKNKKEIARLGGGAMAALWGGDPNGITLELSLEINKKLQAVLEDTLLKNITLKENIDTLGAEISRLKHKPDTK